MGSYEIPLDCYKISKVMKYRVLFFSENSVGLSCMSHNWMFTEYLFFFSMHLSFIFLSKFQIMRKGTDPN